jgi:hypothetical protein
LTVAMTSELLYAIFTLAAWWLDSKRVTIVSQT